MRAAWARGTGRGRHAISAAAAQGLAPAARLLTALPAPVSALASRPSPRSRAAGRGASAGSSEGSPPPPSEAGFHGNRDRGSYVSIQLAGRGLRRTLPARPPPRARGWGPACRASGSSRGPGEVSCHVRGGVGVGLLWPRGGIAGPSPHSAAGERPARLEGNCARRRSAPSEPRPTTTLRTGPACRSLPLAPSGKGARAPAESATPFLPPATLIVGGEETSREQREPPQGGQPPHLSAPGRLQGEPPPPAADGLRSGGSPRSTSSLPSVLGSRFPGRSRRGLNEAAPPAGSSSVCARTAPQTFPQSFPRLTGSFGWAARMPPTPVGDLPPHPDRMPRPGPAVWCQPAVRASALARPQLRTCLAGRDASLLARGCGPERGGGAQGRDGRSGASFGKGREQSGAAPRQTRSTAACGTGAENEPPHLLPSRCGVCSIFSAASQPEPKSGTAPVPTTRSPLRPAHPLSAALLNNWGEENDREQNGVCVRVPPVSHCPPVDPCSSVSSLLDSETLSQGIPVDLVWNDQNSECRLRGGTCSLWPHTAEM